MLQGNIKILRFSTGQAEATVLLLHLFAVCSKEEVLRSQLSSPPLIQRFAMDSWVTGTGLQELKRRKL